MCNRIIARSSIRENTRKLEDFSNPTTIFLLLTVNRELHKLPPNL